MILSNFYSELLLFLSLLCSKLLLFETKKNIFYSIYYFLRIQLTFTSAFCNKGKWALIVIIVFGGKIKIVPSGADNKKVGKIKATPSTSESKKVVNSFGLLPLISQLFFCCDVEHDAHAPFQRFWCKKSIYILWHNENSYIRPPVESFFAFLNELHCYLQKIEQTIIYIFMKKIYYYFWLLLYFFNKTLGKL